MQIEMRVRRGRPSGVSDTRVYTAAAGRARNPPSAASHGGMEIKADARLLHGNKSRR